VILRPRSQPSEVIKQSLKFRIALMTPQPRAVSRSDTVARRKCCAVLDSQGKAVLCPSPREKCRVVRLDRWDVFSELVPTWRQFFHPRSGPSLLPNFALKGKFTEMDLTPFNFRL
jgi:hypothetical protein